jgi:hypothetical protein
MRKKGISFQLTDLFYNFEHISIVLKYVHCRLQVENFLDEIQQCSLVVMDGNIPVETMDYVLQVCKNSQIPGREHL